jgi:hypothetical protein
MPFIPMLRTDILQPHAFMKPKFQRKLNQDLKK